MRAFAAVPVAILVCMAAPAFADAGTHVKAAKKAERRREWRRALQEWKAAYAAELNAEYLIGIGDAQAKLGNTAEAKKSYQAYLAAMSEAGPRLCCTDRRPVARQFPQRLQLGRSHPPPRPSALAGCRQPPFQPPNQGVELGAIRRRKR